MLACHPISFHLVWISFLIFLTFLKWMFEYQNLIGDAHGIWHTQFRPVIRRGSEPLRITVVIPVAESATFTSQSLSSQGIASIVSDAPYDITHVLWCGFLVRRGGAVEVLISIQIRLVNDICSYMKSCCEFNCSRSSNVKIASVVYRRRIHTYIRNIFLAILLWLRKNSCKK